MVQSASKKWKLRKRNQHELNISLCYQFFTRLYFQAGTKYHLSRVNKCNIKMVGSFYKPHSCLCPAQYIQALHKLLAEDPILEFKPQAQGTGHLLGCGNWEALSWCRPYTVGVKWVIVPDLSVRDWGYLLPLLAERLSLPAVTPQGAAAPPLLCSRPFGTWLPQGIVHPCRGCQQPPSYLPSTVEEEKVMDFTMNTMCDKRCN